jgi:phosphatidylglycerophosphatase A
MDVVKPWPARALERLPGGLGIMADDVAAGIYAQLILRVGLAIWPIA